VLPEDFMDEEDPREAEESKSLKTSSDLAGFGSTHSDLTRNGGLMDLFKATGTTIGTKLLQRMGWKEGQGPKIRTCHLILLSLLSMYFILFVSHPDRQ
jgi:G patch domain-containing protein 1